MAKQSSELSLDVIKIIDYLVGKNNSKFTISKSTLIVIMYVYSYERPITDLIHILCEYPHLDSNVDLAEIFRDCINCGFFIEKKYAQFSVCCASDDLPYKLSNDLSDYTISEQMKKAKEFQDSNPCAVFLGSVSNKNYVSLINRFLYAQEQIWLTFLNTAPYEDMVSVLKQRAIAGIKIRILLADEKIIKSIRKTNRNVLNEWINIFKDTNNVEIRVFSRLSDINLCSSVLIDNNILRLVAFDPLRQKSSYGTLIEFQKNAYKINIVTIFEERYKETWNSSRNIKENLIQKIIKSHILLNLISVIMLLAIVNISQNVWLNYLISALLGGLIWNAIKLAKPKLSSFYKKIFLIFK